MLHLNLQPIFLTRGIEQPFRFLVKNGFIPFTANTYNKNKMEQIRLDQIVPLCTLLNCSPNELFEWKPNDSLDDQPDHPLQMIRSSDKKIDSHKLLTKLSMHKSELEHVEQLCILLDITPNDVFEWEPTTLTAEAKKHPEQPARKLNMKKMPAKGVVSTKKEDSLVTH